PGYAQAALAADNFQVIFHSGQGQGAQTQITLAGGGFYSFYFIQNGSTADFLARNPADSLNRGPVAVFSEPAANPDNQFDHLRVIPSSTQSQTLFTWEDSTFGGDHDFNDMEFTINLTLLKGAVHPYEYPVKAIDADSDPVTYSLTQAPQG